MLFDIISAATFLVVVTNSVCILFGVASVDDRGANIHKPCVFENIQDTGLT